MRQNFRKGAAMCCFRDIPFRDSDTQRLTQIRGTSANPTSSANDNGARAV